MMDEFSESTLKASHPFLEVDQSFGVVSQYGEYFNGNAMESAGLGLVDFSGDNYFIQPPEFMMPLVENFSDFLPAETLNSIPGAQPAGSAAGLSLGGNRKRKAPETTSGSSSALPSESAVTDDKSKKRNSSGGGKRGRSNSKDVVEKPHEVVHVRARRGQATDSHSLAERVRREKINERMKCLQNLVPGCCKTMGMSGTLDEIINYVQSLQNQVEFLSMKLSAASSIYDFNMDSENMETQQVGGIYETQEVKRLAREGYGGSTSFHSIIHDKDTEAHVHFQFR